MNNEFVDLLSVCDFQGGSQPPKRLWLQNPAEGYVRMLQIRDFTQSSTKPEYVPLDNKLKLCEKDDVLIARYGASVGKILTGLQGAYNVALMKCIPDTSLLLKQYLYYFLQTKYFQKLIKNVGSRSAQAGFNKNDLKKIKIFLPSIKKQELIIKILNTCENVITNRRQQIEALSALKQSIFVDMFGTVKTNNYSFKKSKLGDFALLVTSGSTPKGGSASYLKEGVPLIRSQNVLWNELRLEDVVFISEETHKNMKRSQLNNRDVLLNITGASIGRSVVYRGADFEANVNQHVCIIRLNEYINPYYLSYYFANEEFQKNVVNKNIGATRQAFNYTQIKNFDILVPDLSLQNAFEDKVKQVDKYINLLSNSLEQMNLLYDSILHKSFNGELFKEGMKV